MQPVRPRRLSHILLFSPDVLRMVAFAADVLGLRLSDHSGDGIAFLHGAHGSDHHLVAFAKSHAAACTTPAGAWQRRRGRPRHGADARGGLRAGWGWAATCWAPTTSTTCSDPWGSFAEYSFDIDFVPHDLDWPAADHPGEDSFYVWGPPLPEEFIVNHEVPA